MAEWSMYERILKAKTAEDYAKIRAAIISKYSELEAGPMVSILDKWKKERCRDT